MEYSEEGNYSSTSNKDGFDLIVYQCGMEKCKSSYSYGPAVRDHYIIHFILEGTGTYYANNKTYKLGKNEGFLICPNETTYYEADDKNPWVYTWIGFKGIKAEQYLNNANLNIKNPIFKYEYGDFIENCFKDIKKASNLKYGKELRLQALLGIILSELIEKAENNINADNDYRQIYITKTLQYIEYNFTKNIKIEEIANNIGLNKNYFSSIFKQKLGISPQEYIIKFRIDKACELMRNNTLSIGDISRSVGYRDPYTFSKIFKKFKGKCPKEYRQDIL